MSKFEYCGSVMLIICDMLATVMLRNLNSILKERGNLADWETRL